jgi:hypothetical protein
MFLRITSSQASQKFSLISAKDSQLEESRIYSQFNSIVSTPSTTMRMSLLEAWLDQEKLLPFASQLLSAWEKTSSSGTEKSKQSYSLLLANWLCSVPLSSTSWRCTTTSTELWLCMEVSPSKTKHVNSVKVLISLSELPVEFWITSKEATSTSVPLRQLFLTRLIKCWSLGSKRILIGS